VIEESIIGSGVQVLDNTRISRGCLVGKNVVLGPEGNLSDFKMVTRLRPKDDDWADDENQDEGAAESAIYRELIRLLS